MNFFNVPPVLFIGSMGFFCSMIPMLGKTKSHENERLATIGCMLLSSCLIALSFFLQIKGVDTIPYFGIGGTIFMVYILFNLIAGGKIPLLFFCIFFIAYLSYLAFICYFLIINK